MSVIKKACGAAIGALSMSMLVSGNAAPIITTNCLVDKSASIVNSNATDIYKMCMSIAGMNHSLTGYNVYGKNNLGIENVVMNEEKMNNLKKLDEIASLPDNWNGNGAETFDKRLISRVRGLITALEIQPEIFPTACDSIQMEYDKEDGSYLEIEINLDDTWEVFQINENGEESYSSIAADMEAITKVVNSFYG